MSLSRRKSRERTLSVIHLHHVAQAAVHVFVNAVEPGGDDILRVEQQGKDGRLVGLPCLLAEDTEQPAIDIIIEWHVAAHVRGRVVEALPFLLECKHKELVYKRNGFLEAVLNFSKKFFLA